MPTELEARDAYPPQQKRAGVDGAVSHEVVKATAKATVLREPG
jgi:hypothetical protein